MVKISTNNEQDKVPKRIRVYAVLNILISLAINASLASKTGIFMFFMIGAIHCILWYCVVKDPLSPYDFDYKFNQAANPTLQLSEYLDIHSSIILTNLTVSNERAVLRIPDVIVFCEQHTQHQTRILHNMYIDTVIIDIDNDDKEQWAVYVSYRSFVKKRQDYESVSCHFLTNELLKEEV